jgi:hypothetical protein
MSMGKQQSELIERSKQDAIEFSIVPRAFEVAAHKTKEPGN